MLGGPAAGAGGAVAGALGWRFVGREGVAAIGNADESVDSADDECERGTDADGGEANALV